MTTYFTSLGFWLRAYWHAGAVHVERDGAEASSFPIARRSPFMSIQITEQPWGQLWLAYQFDGVPQTLISNDAGTTWRGAPQG